MAWWGNPGGAQNLPWSPPTVVCVRQLMTRNLRHGFHRGFYVVQVAKPVGKVSFGGQKGDQMRGRPVRLPWFSHPCPILTRVSHVYLFRHRLEKMRASCAKEFESHWQCLEHNNQVGP